MGAGAGEGDFQGHDVDGGETAAGGGPGGGRGGREVALQDGVAGEGALANGLGVCGAEAVEGDVALDGGGPDGVGCISGVRDFGLGVAGEPAHGFRGKAVVAGQGFGDGAAGLGEGTPGRSGFPAGRRVRSG